MPKDATATACVVRCVQPAYAVKNVFKQKAAVTVSTAGTDENFAKNVVNASLVLSCGSRFRSRKSRWRPLIPEQNPLISS
jgi:hypothetical protein